MLTRSFEDEHQKLYLQELEILIPTYSLTEIKISDERVRYLFEFIDFTKKKNILEFLKILDTLNIKEQLYWLNYINEDKYGYIALKDRIFENFGKNIIKYIITLGN